MSDVPRDDAYAATYMKGASRVLLRDKVVGKKALVVLGLMTLWCGGGAVATFLNALPKSSVGVGLFLVLMTAFFAFLATTLTVLRTVVSEGEVHVQHGLWGPRVPITRINECRVTKYDWKRFGGWGIKRSADGTWAYVMSSGGDVVELCFTDKTGIDRTVLFSASDPHAVVASIERARATAASPGARIATDEAAEGKRVVVDDEVEEVVEEAEVSRNEAKLDSHAGPKK